MIRVLFILGTALLAAVTGYLGYHYLLGENGGSPDTTSATALDGLPLVGQRRPDYTLGSTDGSIVSAADFNGTVVLVNFWATWCAPCREEMPMLMALRRQYSAKGLEVVGIALDDVQRARDFAGELAIEYPVLVGSTDVMATMSLYGNHTGTLPYSVLIDRNGIIRWTRLGVLEQPALEHEIQALIADS